MKSARISSGSLMWRSSTNWARWASWWKTCLWWCAKTSPASAAFSGRSTPGRTTPTSSFSARLSGVWRVACLSPDEGCVNLNRAGQLLHGRNVRPHCKANAVRHEPRALVGDLQHAVQLMGAERLLARTNDEHGHEPFANGNMRILEDRADRNGELLSTRRAFVNALAGRSFARGPGHELVNLVELAMRADRTVRPPQRFKQCTRFVVV